MASLEDKMRIIHKRCLTSTDKQSQIKYVKYLYTSICLHFFILCSYETKIILNQFLIFQIFFDRASDLQFQLEQQTKE